MASGYHDNNHTPSLMAVSSADGKTPVAVYADPTTHRLLTTNTATTTGGATGQTTTNSNVVQVTVGGSDTIYWVNANLVCTAFVSGSLNVNVVYTGTHGNVRTVPFQGHFTSGYGINVTGTGDFECQALQIKAQANSTITITTSGTFTLTYDVFGAIEQIS